MCLDPILFNIGFWITNIVNSAQIDYLLPLGVMKYSAVIKAVEGRGVPKPPRF